MKQGDLFEVRILEGGQTINKKKVKNVEELDEAVNFVRLKLK